MLIPILAVCFLVALSVLFSVGEAALIGASEARIYQKLKSEPARLNRVHKILSNKDRIIGALLIGNSVVNVIASVITTTACVKLWGEEMGALVSTVVMSVIVVVFAEVLPKTYAVKYADQMTLSLSLFILTMAFIFKPISWATHSLARAIFRLSPNKSYVVSPHDEIKGVINLLHKEGTFVKSDRDMLGGILTLKELIVADVMIHRKNMVALDIGQPSDVLVQEILASAHTRLPLYQENVENIVGVVHAKDVLVALAQAHFDPKKINFSDVIKAPWFIPESTKLEDQLNHFLLERSHFALVVDEYGALMGLITLEDILEEIVGNITDEHDTGDQMGVYAQEDGSFLVRGDVPIRDVNRALDLELPDDEATTMAGLVIYTIQAIPESGQVFKLYGFRFEIVKRQNNQVTLMRMSPLPKDESDA